MTIIVFNAFSFILLLFIYWFRWRQFDFGFILIATYTFVSVLGVFYFVNNSFKWMIISWPYIYLFVVLMLFFRPYFINHQKFYDGFRLRNVKFLKIFSKVFIFSGFLVIFYQIPIVIENLESGEWLAIRDTLYYDDEFHLYESQIERLVKIFIQYFRLPAILALFYYLSSGKNKRYFNLVFAISIIVPSFFTAIIIAARGSLLVLLIELTIGYFIFKKNIPKKIKKYINVSAITILSIIVIFSIAVTASRFGELNQSSSLMFYFSHSFLSFNNGVADTITTYADGKYFFNYFYDNKVINFNALGSHFGTSFITFVGTLYIDFGPVGTFLIALIVPSFFNFRRNSKKYIDFADLYLYAFYLSYLINGVFVVGFSNSLDWIITILFYILLKFRKI